MEPIRRKTGLVLDAYFSATKLRWILSRRRRPDTGGARGAVLWDRGNLAHLEAHRADSM